MAAKGSKLSKEQKDARKAKMELNKKNKETQEAVTPKSESNDTIKELKTTVDSVNDILEDLKEGDKMLVITDNSIMSSFLYKGVRSKLAQDKTSVLIRDNNYEIHIEGNRKVVCKCNNKLKALGEAYKATFNKVYTYKK